MSISYDEKNAINMLKMIAIVLVVYIHSYSVGGVNFVDGTANQISAVLSFFEEFVSNGICSSAVSIMFTVSGYLSMLKVRPVLETYRKKWISLVVPYIIWNTLWIVLFLLLQSFSITKPFFSNETNIIRNWVFIDWLKAYGISATLNHPFVYPLWFIRDLVFIFLFQPFISMFIGKWYKVIVPVLILCLFIPIDISIKNSFCFFVIGMGLVKYDINILKCKCVKNIVIPIYLLIVVVNTIYHNYYIKMIMMILGCIIYVKIAVYLTERPKKNGITFVMSEIFFVYVFHELALTCFKKVCYRILPQFQIVQLCEYVLIPIVIIILSCTCGHFLRRLLPNVYSVLTGNRRIIT